MAGSGMAQYGRLGLEVIGRVWCGQVGYGRHGRALIGYAWIGMAGSAGL